MLLVEHPEQGFTEYVEALELWPYTPRDDWKYLGVPDSVISAIQDKRMNVHHSPIEPMVDARLLRDPEGVERLFGSFLKRDPCRIRPMNRIPKFIRIAGILKLRDDLGVELMDSQCFAPAAADDDNGQYLQMESKGSVRGPVVHT